MDGNLILLAIAGLQAYTAYISYKTREVAVETKVLAKQVEVATNSMKDALVKATGEAAHAAGKVEGIAEGKVEAAVLAQGVLQQKEQP